MIDLLSKIWCECSAIPWHIADLIMAGINGIIVALVAAAAVALALFPPLPELPDGVGPDVLQWANWLFPIGPVLALFGVYLGLFFIARMYIGLTRILDRFGVGLGGWGH
jgi:hypothetical protein